MMDALPTLTTERLTLRPFTLDDLPRVVQLHRHPEVTQYLLKNMQWGEAEAREWLEDLLTHYAHDGAGQLAVVRNRDQIIIGRSGLSTWLIEGEVELGYTFGKDFWGQGYAPEASQAMRDYAFEVLELPRLISLINEGNLASKNVARKNGFIIEKTVEMHGRSWEIWVQTARQWGDHRLEELAR